MERRNQLISFWPGFLQLYHIINHVASKLVFLRQPHRSFYMLSAFPSVGGLSISKRGKKKKIAQQGYSRNTVEIYERVQVYNLVVYFH